jgi:hypothetical protein
MFGEIAPKFNYMEKGSDKTKAHNKGDCQKLDLSVKS